MIRADILADGAWQELGRAVSAYVGRRVSNAADRDDIVQEVLLRVHRGVGGLADQTRPGPWIYGIARNTVVDHWRRKARRAEAAVESAEAEAADIPDVADEDGLQQALAAFVAGRIAALPSPYRETLTLTELQEIKQADAAAMLGVSLPAIKSRVLRGRALLRAALEDCCSLEFSPTGRIVECVPPAEASTKERCEACS